MGSALAISTDEKRVYTYADYLTWPDSERWEIINGQAFAMSPAPGRYHQEILLNIATPIKNYLKGKPCKVYVAPFDVRLQQAHETEQTASSVVQPDITVVCDQSKLDDKGCKGSPDLVVEIVSPSSARKDMNDKFSLYEAHGVREYWVVHPSYHLIQVYSLDNGRYKKVGDFSPGDTLKVGIFEDLSLSLCDIFEVEAEAKDDDVGRNC